MLGGSRGRPSYDIQSDETLFLHPSWLAQPPAFISAVPQDFAKTALVDPVVINVGRAGAANLDVIQEAACHRLAASRYCAMYRNR